MCIGVCIWGMLLPGFYRISVNSLQRQRPDIADLHHPLAYVLACLWPVVLAAAILKGCWIATGRFIIAHEDR